jgi:hypothetical protein
MGPMKKTFTDHTNLMRDALGSTLDRVYQWRLLLEEYGPKITYIEGIHNTVADAVLGLIMTPESTKQLRVTTRQKSGTQKSRQGQNWMTVLKNWYKLDIDLNINKHDDWNLVFAHHKEEDKIYPPITIEIAEAQGKDQELIVYFKKNAKMPQKDICLQLIEDTKVLCKDGKLIIPKSLRHRAVSWCHNYLQHPRHSCLKKTMRSAMFWKGMCTTIWRYVESCRSCQVNKRHSQEYGHLSPKLVITTPWRVLCVDLIGPYTLKGKDDSSIDFMCLTMINQSHHKLVQNSGATNC